MADHVHRDRLIHGLTTLIGAVRAMGAEAARDTLAAHYDLGDGGDDPWESHMIDLIGHALLRAHEIDHDATRCITVEAAARGQRVHFSWEDTREPLSGAFRAAVHNAVRLAVGSSPPRVPLPLDPSEPRQWSVAEHSGDCFRDDDDYDGWILEIEIRDEAEAERVAAHMRSLWPMEAPHG